MPCHGRASCGQPGKFWQRSLESAAVGLGFREVMLSADPCLSTGNAGAVVAKLAAALPLTRGRQASMRPLPSMSHWPDPAARCVLAWLQATTWPSSCCTRPPRSTVLRFLGMPVQGLAAHPGLSLHGGSSSRSTASAALAPMFHGCQQPPNIQWAPASAVRPATYAIACTSAGTSCFKSQNHKTS